MKAGATITAIHLPRDVEIARDRLVALEQIFMQWRRIVIHDLAARVDCYEKSKALAALFDLSACEDRLRARAETTWRMWLRRARWATSERLVADVASLERLVLSAATVMAEYVAAVPKPVPDNVVPFRRPEVPP